MTTETNDLIGHLRRHPFFNGMSDAHLAVLAEYALPVSFQAGEKIFAEGDAANRFYLIESGEVILSAEATPHEHQEVQILQAGDVLGWSWLFPPYYWHFSADAKTPVAAVFFYGTRLRERCEQDTSLGYEMMKRVSEIVIKRLQKNREELLDLKKTAR